LSDNELKKNKQLVVTHFVDDRGERDERKVDKRGGQYRIDIRRALVDTR
jgi:hypothetical protein